MREMGTACHSHPLHEKTILERAMAACRLADITPSRTSQEAEETKGEMEEKDPDYVPSAQCQI